MDELNIYICGPTVYADSHLGHARAYIMFDVLNRISKYCGFNTNVAMNITDIDDKIIHSFLHSMHGEKYDIDTYIAFVREHEERFNEDMKSLNIIPPNIITRVTEYIPQIITFIEKIQKNGYAYEFEGSIYFDSSKYFKSSVGQQDKIKSDGWQKPIEDFVLWKKRKPEDGEIYFPSVFGEGRPGWHIECSTMATDVHGDHLHIHGGGADLKFPHHHNEDLQVKAFYNKVKNWNWVDMWMHIGRLEVVDSYGTSRKMGKSLKNFITIREYLDRYSAQSLRLMFLEQDYKKAFIYNNNQAQLAISKRERKIYEFFKWVHQLPPQTCKEDHLNTKIAEKIKFFSNIKKVIIVHLSQMETHKVMDLIYILQKESMSYFIVKTDTLQNNYKFILEMTKTLGLNFDTFDDEKIIVGELYAKVKLFLKNTHVLIQEKKNITVENFVVEFKQIVNTDTYSFDHPGIAAYNDLRTKINNILDETEKSTISLQTLTDKIYEVLDSFRATYDIGDFK